MIENKINIAEEQQDFMKNRRTADATFTVCMLY